jgi:hypothetical protein
MNRRDFLVVSTCAVGVMFIPFDSVCSSPRMPAPPGPDRRRRMLYGSAATACAQLPDSFQRPDLAPWHGVE